MVKVAVILTDAERQILWVNQDFEDITGYRYDEVLGKSPGSILQGPESERDAIDRIRLGLSSGVPIKEELTNYRKNGEPYLCKLVIHPVYNSMKQLVNYLAFEVNGDQVTDDSVIPIMQLNNKYQSSSLRGMDEVRLFERITKVLENDLVYLDPDLSLKKMAEMVDTNTKYLSQVINHFSACNFLCFINNFRIRHIKQRFENEDHRKLTFYGVAQECGFKNKSTFYKVFRDHTGMTPNMYTRKNFSKRKQVSVS